MADVTLTYKGSDILELSDSGSATLKTGGKYCEDDVTVEYVKPSGGGGSNTLTKLGEITITEPVRAFAINLTEEMRSKDILVVRLVNLTKDASDWTYVNFDSLAFTIYFSQRLTDNVDGYIFNIHDLQYAESQQTAASYFVAQTSGTLNTSSSNVIASTIGFRCYAQTKNFISGSVEIWG